MTKQETQDEILESIDNRLNDIENIGFARGFLTASRVKQETPIYDEADKLDDVFELLKEKTWILLADLRDLDKESE